MLSQPWNQPRSTRCASSISRISWLAPWRKESQAGGGIDEDSGGRCSMWMGRDTPPVNAHCRTAMLSRWSEGGCHTSALGPDEQASLDSVAPGETRMTPKQAQYTPAAELRQKAERSCSRRFRCRLCLDIPLVMHVLGTTSLWHPGFLQASHREQRRKRADTHSAGATSTAHRMRNKMPQISPMPLQAHSSDLLSQEEHGHAFVFPNTENDRGCFQAHALTGCISLRILCLR